MHKWVSFLLLSVFTLMLAQNLLVTEHRDEHCHEFGHIHHSEKSDCKGSASVLLGFVLSEKQIILPSIPVLTFSVVDRLESQFPSPDLVPRKRPPRNS